MITPKIVAAANKLFSALNVNVKMHNLYLSVSSAEIVAIMEGSAENMAAVKMVTSSTGTFSSFKRSKSLISSQ